MERQVTGGYYSKRQINCKPRPKTIRDRFRWMASGALAKEQYA